MDDADPALAFFPDGKVDLYAALDVKEDASEADIRKAYRRLALRFHPDKVLSRSANEPGGTNDQEAHVRFQQIGFAYAVLNDEGRRKRYDATGRTDELKFGMGDGETTDWDAYFATLWTGNVSGSTLDEFKKKYQQSDDERKDILAAYEETKGSLSGILSLVPCLDVLEDEQRVIDFINAAIAAKDIDELPAWRAGLADTKGRENMRKEAKKEASEAEAYAKELGVWDELFGKSGKKGARRQGKDMKGEAEHDGVDDEEEEEEEDDEEDEKPRKGKAKASKAKAEPKSKAKATKAKPAAKGKKGKAAAAATADEDEEDGEDRLAALFAKRAKERQGGFNGLVERLEAQAREEEAKAAAKKGSKSKAASSSKAPSKAKAASSKASTSSKPASRRRSPPAPGMDPDPLDDDEFAKIQQAMMERAQAGKKGAAGAAKGGASKRKADEAAEEEEERKSALKTLAEGRKKKKQKA